MNLKKQLTFKDILKEANIDYDNVEQDLIELANNSETEDEFFQKFDTYFSEHGLGGDDCHEDAVRLLQLFIDKEENSCKQNKISLVKAKFYDLCKKYNTYWLFIFNSEKFNEVEDYAKSLNLNTSEQEEYDNWVQTMCEEF